MSKLLVLGGTGYVGHHLLPRLCRAGHRVTVLSRNRERHRELFLLANLRQYNADVHDPDILARHMEGKDAVINLVGILDQSRATSFDKVHVELARNLVTACDKTGTPRLLQMSALNAAQGESDYLRSRHQADQVIQDSGLDWSILSCAVLFGGGGGLIERFASLLRMAPVLPLPRPDARMAPLCVVDVATTLIRCLDGAARRQMLELYGPETMTLLEIVRQIARAMGKRRWIVPLPNALGAVQASLAGLVPGVPLSRDNFASLATDSVGSEDALAQLRIEPHRFSQLLPELVSGPNRAAHYNALRESLRDWVRRTP